jgi:protein SCO1
VRLAGALAIGLWALSASTAYAQYGDAPPRPNAANVKSGILKEVSIDQKIGQQLPLDLTFKDERGNDVRLGQYFGGKPVVMALAYYECPMLCTQVLNGLVSALGVLNFDVGREFDVVAVSINPKEPPALAAEKKQAYLDRYKRPQSAAGWHFLTGKEENIKQLAAAVGFRYAFDPQIQQYAHGAGIELLTPKGVISKYFYGIEFSARDIRFGVIEASDEHIGTPIDDVLLLCYHYDPATGKYGATAIDAVRIGGVATMLGLGTFIFISLRKERTGH